ncbi:MAG: cupredoxin domain-containing protein [Dehalococcoidia bacterium]
MNRPYYTRVALLGLCLYLSFVVLLLGLSLALQPDDWEYPCIVGSIALTLIVILYFWRPWGLVVGLLAGLIGIPFSLDGVRDNLSSPNSFIDFAYRPVVTLAGVILLLTGCSLGLVQHFRKRTSNQGPKSVSWAIAGLLGLVSVICLYSVVMTFTGVDSVSAADREGATVVKAKDFKFDTDALTASAAGETKFVVSNKDYIVHTFTIDGLDVDAKVGPRGEALVVLRSPPPGTYIFHCTVPGHESMRGTLTVQ